MNVKDTYLIFFHTGKSQFVMDLQRYKNKWVKETRLKRYGNLRHCEPRETQSFHDPTLGDVGEAESESQYVNSGWREGRRVVELCILAENLAQCSAEGCDLLQDLRTTVSEYRSGLGSLLWIQCSCGQLNKVHSYFTIPKHCVELIFA